MGKDQDVCSVNAAGADNKYMISTYSLPDSIASPQGRPRSVHLLGRWAPAPTLSATAESASKAQRIRRSRASTSPCERGKSFVPALSLRPRPGDAPGLSNPGALSLRQVLLPVLQSRNGHWQDGFDDLCRCSGWHGSGSGGPAQRQGPARQRVPLAGRSNPPLEAPARRPEAWER